MADDPEKNQNTNNDNSSDEGGEKGDTPKDQDTPKTDELPVRDLPSDKQSGGGEGGDEIDPDDEKMVSQIAGKRISPLEEKVSRIEDQARLSEFYNNIEDEEEKKVYQKFDKQIREAMNHPNYKGVGVEVIANWYARNDLQKLGAEKANRAKTKENESQVGGNSARTNVDPNSPAGDVWGRSSEEHQEMVDRVKRGEFAQTQ